MESTPILRRDRHNSRENQEMIRLEDWEKQAPSSFEGHDLGDFGTEEHDVCVELSRHIMLF